MAYLPREVFNHYIHGPYMHPVCQEFLENSGCKGDCMLAHPAKRVRIFHPRFLYEAFPAGLVICCKNFVLYGDCACQHMDPAAKREINLDMFFHPPLHIRNYLRKKILGPEAKDAAPPPPKDEDAIAKEEEDLIRLLEELKCSEESRAVRTTTAATQTSPCLGADESGGSNAASSAATIAAALACSPTSEYFGGMSGGGGGSPSGAVQQRRHTTPSRMRHSFPPPPPPSAPPPSAVSAEFGDISPLSGHHHHHHHSATSAAAAAAAAAAALSPRPVRNSSRRLSVPSPTQVTSPGLLSEQRRRFWLLTQQLHLIAAMTGRSLSPDPAVLAACPPLDDQAIKAALNLPATAELPPIFHFLRLRAQQQPGTAAAAAAAAAAVAAAGRDGASGGGISGVGSVGGASGAATMGTDALTQLLSSANPFPFAMPGSGLGYGLNC